MSSICDSVTGQCPCKELVEGRTCDTCRPGFWKLNALSTKGCEGKAIEIKYGKRLLYLEKTISHF